MAIAIKAENISKQYRLGYVGSGSLKDDARRWWARMRGKEDPLLTIGETNDRSTKAESDYVWALKDINFEIEQGDTVGIIGRNGAGKSTLLKLLSKVTAPTTGNIKVKGRIASLLEVGTGFHGELTGRENIYLNGAIMGMRKHEITRKLDEIVDFAGVERYLDTPVKRYSSGMYVRLGFAVAAHLENEILIVDEVLAVGDAEFQKKCLGKMRDVSKGEGRTVLFVSHNMGSIKKLCNTGLVLMHGKIGLQQSDINTLINLYLTKDTKKITEILHEGSGESRIQDVYLINSVNEKINEVVMGENKIRIVVEIEHVYYYNKHLELVIGVYDAMDECHVFFSSSNTGIIIKSEEDRKQRVVFELPSSYYPAPGVYTINVCLNGAFGYVDYVKDCYRFDIIQNKDEQSVFKHANSKSVVEVKAKIKNG